MEFFACHRNGVFLDPWSIRHRDTPGVSENPMRSIPTTRNTTYKLFCLRFEDSSPGARKDDFWPYETAPGCSTGSNLDPKSCACPSQHNRQVMGIQGTSLGILSSHRSLSSHIS